MFTRCRLLQDFPYLFGQNGLFSFFMCVCMYVAVIDLISNYLPLASLLEQVVPVQLVMLGF